jgi:NitT/TauT family transport system substrate-binding protein
MFGNQYPVEALKAKYGITKDLVQQDFTMNQFDSNEITLATAMTYNELGLTQNNYTGALGYGDTVGVVDVNEEGVAIIEDCLIVKKSWAEANKDTLVKFIRASLKGWKYACEGTDAARIDEVAQIVFKSGTSVSQDHQKHMAAETKKLVLTRDTGATISLDEIGKLFEDSIANSLKVMQDFVTFEDTRATDRLKGYKYADIATSVYWTEAAAA